MSTIPTITPAECRRLLDSNPSAMLIDVRTPAEFSAVHATAARSVPLDSLDPAAVAGSRKSDQDPIYLICHSGGRSGNACERFLKAGIPTVFSVEGGTSAWERAGLPVVRGTSKVIAMERQVRIVAGLLVLLGIALSLAVHPYFLGLSAFVGAGLVFAGVTNFCGMAIVLGKMPWNR